MRKNDRPALGMPRSDAVLTGIILTVSLAQVLWIQPVRSLWFPNSLWFGPVFAVVSVLPLAWRRTRPLAAAAVSSSLWWMPTDAFLFLGYVCAVLIFFAVGRWSSSVRGGYLVCLWGLTTGTLGFLAIEQAENRLPLLMLDVDVQQRLGAWNGSRAELMLGIVGFWLLILGSYALGRFLTAEDQAGQRRVAAERDAVRRDAAATERAHSASRTHSMSPVSRGWTRPGPGWRSTASFRNA